MAIATRDGWLARTGRAPFLCRAGDEFAHATSSDTFWLIEVSKGINLAAIVDYIADAWPSWWRHSMPASPRPPSSALGVRGLTTYLSSLNPRSVEVSSAWLDESSRRCLDLLRGRDRRF